MASNSFYSNKDPVHVKTESAVGARIDPGPFIGKVKSNVDPARLGRLRVYIPELGGLDEEDENNWRTVSYSSPFIGTTKPATENTANQYGATRQSYGFWMTPPDVGNNVICIFINGSPDQGYYIGCVPDMTAHHMVPAIASTETADIATLSPKGLQDAGTNKFLPVVEFNRNEVNNIINPDIYTNVKKPVHELQLEHLARQGLVGDRTRGPISSTSMRESPSNVFGFSTPGRVLAKNSDNIQEVWLREGGHSLVMDDGDEKGNDNLVRLRTSNGHQIMLNDSAGVIYIINANGNAWFEMGADGSIRMFSDADVSINCTSDFNVNAGGSINMAAGANINLKADGNFNAESGGNFNMHGKANLTAYASGKLGLAGNSVDIMAQTRGNFTGAELNFVGEPILLNSGPSVNVKAPPAVQPPPIIPLSEPWPRPEGTEEGINASPLELVAPPPPGSPRKEDKSRPDPAVNDETKNVAGVPGQKIGDIIATTPQPQGGIGILTAFEVKVLFANIAKTESNGNYRAVNSIGYSGKYQFGVAALEDFGYVQKGTWAKYGRNIVLKRPEVWAGKDGINNLEDWLNSPAVQEQVMFRNTKRNYDLMVKNGAIREGDPPEVVAGMLKVAHLLGAGGYSKKLNKYVGALAWRLGQGGADAYGTTGDKYFAQGKQAILAMANRSGGPTAA